ncbi:MAG: hypothetical protein IJ693_00735 [Bacteroidaceae bacterium]|nr:hypothetical protein [Bacteroidaceae bacterium]
MQRLLNILLLVMATFVWSSCQDLSVPQQITVRHPQEIRASHPTGSWAEGNSDIRYREMTLSNAMSLCRTANQPEERVQTNNGERTSPTFRGGGKAFTVCRAPRSTIHLSLGGFVQQTTLPVRSFASRTYYIYVLRHILR